MRGFLARFLITAFGLFIADALLAGVRVDDVRSLWLASLLLGLVNAFVRPVIVLLTLPLTLLSLGFFLLVINGAMILLVSRALTAFHVDGLGTAMLASIIMGLIGWVANAFIGDGARVEIWSRRS